MKIITSQLADKLPQGHELLFEQVANPLDYLRLNSIITKTKHLTVYDLTMTNERPEGAIISVNDHINKTGKNPLIDNENKQQIDFIDITNLYNVKKNSVITNCCGEELNTKYLYPSHYLCNITILARAREIQKISAFLVNLS